MSNSKYKVIGDRFIPRRAGENFDIANYRLTTTDLKVMDILPPNTPKYINYACQFFAQKVYEDILWKLVEPSPKKILNFTKTNTSNEEKSEEQPWPVMARKKPLITSPLIILDMPGLDTNLCHNIIDWGKMGHIASSYNGEMHIWHPNQSKPVHTHTNHQVKHCVKWNSDGRLLAIALDDSTIYIIDGSSTTEFIGKKTCCKRKKCIVSSMEWSKDDVLLTGCTNGNLSSWFLTLRVGRTVVRAHNGPIIGIRYSCYERYIASSGLDNYIRIWDWPELYYMFEMCSYLPVKAFSWHPWRESLFICSCGKRNSVIALWNIGTLKETHWFISDSNTSIDAMTFNKRTGELVVSFYDAAINKTTVAVFSNLKEISDAIIWHVGRVPYLIWNHKCTKLLTAGADEFLCIWSFFGKNKDNIIGKIKKKEKKFSLDPMSNLNCFGQCIR